MSGARTFLEILVGRGDHPHVDANRRLTTDAIELTFGEYSQQPRLQRRRHVADFIEKQRTAIGLFEAATPQAVGAGERTFLVTEKFRLEQFGWNRRGVKRDKRFLDARTMLVQGARHQFLASTRFSGDEYVDAGARQPADGAEHLLHGRSPAQ